MAQLQAESGYKAASMEDAVDFDEKANVGGRPASIVYLCDYQAPYGGNFIASMVKLDAALAARGIRTLYVFPAGAKERDWYKKMEARGMRLVTLPDGGMAARVRQLTRLLDEGRATILHVHFGLFPLAELAALIRPKLSLILHFHSDFSAGRKPTWRDKLRDAGKHALEWPLGKRLTKITVSERSARTTDDCIRLHNALVKERFTDDLWTRERTRESFAIPADATLVLLFGWSPYIKGVDVAVRAVRRLVHDGHGQFVLGVVCGREYTPERMRAFIEERTGCTGEAPWLRLLPPTEDVFRYHKASDIMLSASRSETFSYALLEAIATGRLCAASDIPGVRWAEVFDTVTFFQTEDDAALAKTLFILDGERGDTACEKRLRDASEQANGAFSIDEWVNGMLRIYGLA